MKLLNSAQLKIFKSSEEFNCIKEQMLNKVVYLDHTFKLFRNTSEGEQLRASAAAKIVSVNVTNARQESCYTIYLAWWSGCLVTYPVPPTQNMSAQNACMDDAFNFLIYCEGFYY